ncbi:unnamed protein product [Rotaria socialis]|uniref:NACHT domain-containing protein n=2 Tax=Rotaria socialis TaxID=392032 RepID=A0A821IDM8_9BILA|nr:unnamed protein product [Rotaria socialis]CAF4700283.1 unnamed protein product [Rotaria socialis]
MDSTLDFVKDHCKDLLKERFLTLKNQIEESRVKYKKEYNNDVACIYGPDPNPTDDTFSNLLQHINDIQETFFGPNEIMLISEQTHQQFDHLLARLINKVQSCLMDRNMYTKQFSYNFCRITNVFLERQQQLERLILTNMPTDDDNYMLAYEFTLQQRQNAFNISTGDSENFSSLKLKYSNTYDLYLRRCLNLHSTMSVHGVFENIEVLMNRIFEQQIIIDDRQRESLELSLKKFDVPLICPPMLCRRIYNLQQNQSDNILALETIDFSKHEKDVDMTLIDLLKSIRSERWIVLIGGPGSGKTTFVRWLTCEMSRNLLSNEENMMIDDIDMGSVRIPILIRIGEFAEWIESHSSSNLFDYIGQNTWLMQTYIDSEFETLQDFVRHGHALIILDGLDEVATFEMYNRINKLIHDFMHAYCMSNDFVSPFDDEGLGTAKLGRQFRCNILPGGNIVILTSRIINYTVQPLQSDLIFHYMIQPMNIEHLSNFIKQWCNHVQYEIIPLLIRYIPQIKGQQAKYKSIFDSKILIKKIESDKGLQSFASNLSVVSIICTLFAQYGIDVLKITRVQLYQQVVESMVQRWQRRRSFIPKDALISIFSDMAFYIHSRSGAGLIDELDLTHLCRLSLRRWYSQHANSTHYSSTTIRQQTQQFMQFISEDAGIVAARALCVYGFLHLTFQEYFVCLALVNIDHSNLVGETIDELVTRYLSFGSNSRLREPLNLAFGWISLHWSFENFDYFCIQLQSKTNSSNKYFPMGSLLFISALGDLACLPSLFTIHNILNSLLELDIDDLYCTFGVQLISALNRLPIDMVISWFDQIFMKENATLSFNLVPILYRQVNNERSLPQWTTTQLSQMLWREFERFNHEIHIYVDRILMIISAVDYNCLPTPSNSLRAYLLAKPIPTRELHSSVIASLIALYGGLEYEDRKHSPLIVFKARRMHRDSPLSYLFINYFNDTTTHRAIKMQHLIDQCHKIVDTTISTNVTCEGIHSLVVLLYFYGIHQSSNYEQYIGSELWQRTVSYMNVVQLHLREFFFLDPRSRFKKNLVDSFEDFCIDSEDTIDLVQSMSHAYCRLLGSQTSFLTQKRFLSEGIALFNIKMPSFINLRNIVNWNDSVIVQRLAFVCCVSLSRYSIETEEVEAEDIHLLKLGIHPFQLLQTKPIALLLSYVPISVQRLYLELFAQKQLCFNEISFLPFFHLLIESLNGLLMTYIPCIRLRILSSILSPIISQYRIENLVRFIASKDNRERTIVSFIKKLNNDSTRTVKSHILIVENYDDVKREYQLIVNKEQYRIDNAQNDLELYAACCCLAKVTRKYDSSIESETILEKMWIFVQAIKQPVWRLDAAINIFYLILPNDAKFKPLADRFKTYFLRLISCLEEIEPTTPLLSYVALFVRCMSVIRDEKFPLEKRLVYNILQRLETVSTNEQSVICEALASLPPFRCDVCQFVRQLKNCPGSNLVFNQIYSSNCKIFAKYFSMHYFKTSDISNVRSTLLTSMYLSEMNSYVQFIDDSMIKRTTQCEIEHEPIEQSLIEKCLMLLKKKPTCSLNVEAASNICELLCSSITELEKMEMSRVEYALVNKENVSEFARPFVLQWLNYRDDKLLNKFAYNGAILLASSKIWTTTIVEICCELMTNEYDHLRDRAIKLIESREWRNVGNGCTTKIIKCLYKWNETELKKFGDIEYILSTLFIETIDQMEEILKFERERFNKAQLDVSKYEVSFFRLMKELSIEATNYVIVIMISLANSSLDSANLLFLQWILEYFQCKCLVSDERFVELLIKLMLGSHDSKLKVIVARNLLYFPCNEQIQNILWTIITNNEHENSDELIATCIFSLYMNDEIAMQEKLKQLDHLGQHTTSLIIRQAALAKMYLYIKKKPEEYDTIDVYYSYMISTSERLTTDDESSSARTAARCIAENASTLLPLFVEDMCKNLNQEPFFGTPAYMEVAESLCRDIPTDFLDAVRQNSFGEIAFRNSVYQSSKKVCLSSQQCCIKVYACFEDVSLHLIEMIMQVVLKEPKVLSYDHLIKSLRVVSGRQPIELLLNILSSAKSLKQRYVAAELLVHLASLNHVSVNEVGKLLNAAIEDPSSQQFLDLGSENTRADYKMKRLLLSLLAEQDCSGRVDFGNIDMINVVSEYKIPAAIFVNINQ